MDTAREQVGATNFPNYLKKFIGKKVSIDFLIGTNKLIHKTGVLKDVGPDYVAFVNPNGLTTIADLFSIKFIDV
ncbi:MAG TPA: hypothetical protein VEB00_05180 [Clostridia bacterium]|nr:hypothetical protein [Clostridia bacterium]